MILKQKRMQKNMTLKKFLDKKLSNNSFELNMKKRKT